MNRNTAIHQFLSELGVAPSNLHGNGPYPCPMHSGTGPTLGVHSFDGFLYFRCSRCKFVGTANQLFTASGRRGVDRDHVLAQLRLSTKDCTLTTPYDDSKQTAAGEYLVKCREALVKTGADLIGRLSARGVNQLALTEWVKTCGAVVSPLPPFLQSLNPRHKHSWSGYLTMPYYRGPTLTHLTVFNPETNDYRTAEITPGYNGVFLERELSWPSVTRVLLCQQPLDALVLHSKYAEYTADRMNVIAASDPEAIRGLIGCTEVCYVHQPGADNPLPYLLKLRRVGWVAGFSVSVATTSRPLHQLPCRELSCLHSTAVPSLQFLAGCLRETWAAGGRTAVAELITVNPFHEQDKAELLSAGLDPELVDAVRVLATTTSEVVVGAGIRIRRDSTGFVQVTPEERRLTNFTLHATSCTDTKSGSLLISGHARGDSLGDPAVPFTLPVSAFTAKGAEFSKRVWDYCVRRGATSNFMSQKLPPGVDWLTILRTMDSIPFRPGVHQLGVLADRIQFPHFSLDLSNHTLAPVLVTPTVSAEHLRPYSAITLCPSYSYRVLASLLLSPSPGKQGLVLGLAHTIHGLVRLAHHDHRLSDPNHLVYCGLLESTSIWRTVVRQLSCLFSHSYSLPEVPASGLPESPVTGLPIIAEFSDDISYHRSVLAKAKQPVIAVAAAGTLSDLPPGRNVSYSVNDLDCSHTPDNASEEELANLRQLFPYLVRDIISSVTPGADELCSRLPALAALSWIESVVGASSGRGLRSLIVEKAEACAADVHEAFLHLLISRIKSGDHQLLHACKPAKMSASCVGFISGDTVTIFRKRALRAVNRSGHNFTDEAVTAGLQKHYGCTTESVSNLYSCWRMDKDVWLRRFGPTLTLLQA